MAAAVLKQNLRMGVITQEEYDQIARINAASFGGKEVEEKRTTSPSIFEKGTVLFSPYQQAPLSNRHFPFHL
jgi:hypothetical protein